MLHPARSYVEISRSQIAANYRAVRELVSPGSGVIGVVKADAYGHGGVEVARVLQAEGIEWLAVSSVEEGVALRTAGIAPRILVMAGVMDWERKALREFRLTPVLHSLDDIRRLNEPQALSAIDPLDVHLKIDTGMSRLGTLATPQEIADALHASPNLRIEGLLSHFASASDFTSAQSDNQIDRFEEVRRQLASRGVKPPLLHMSSTNAIGYPRRLAWFSLVRPGHAIYGYVSPARGDGPPAALRVKPALSWYAKVVSVKDVPAGALVGYGGSFRAPHPMRLAVISAGYADGVPHRLSNRGKVIAGGRLVSIVGTVSMDLTTIDATEVPSLTVGDTVTLLGNEGVVSLDAQQIARVAGTISYNVLCGISKRVKRFYF